MAEMDHLLDTPVDDIPEVDVPEGWYVLRSFYGKLTEEDIDKNGRPYRNAVMGFNIVEPVDNSVDPDVWAAFVNVDGPDEEPVFAREFLARRNDIKKITRTLANAGVPTSGRRLSEILSELKDGYEFVGEVFKREYEGKTYTDVRNLGAKKED